MTGINILNQTEIMEYSGLHYWIIVISFVAFIICVIITTLLDKAGKNFATVILAGIGVIFGIVFIIALIVPEQAHTGRYRYEATIEEFVSFEDIYNNYEVVEQRGELWILEDKEVK